MRAPARFETYRGFCFLSYDPDVRTSSRISPAPPTTST